MRSVLSSIRLIITSSVIILTCSPFAQAQKKPLDVESYEIWNSISNKGISDYSDMVYYILKPGKGDQTLYWRSSDVSGNAVRAHKPALSYRDSLLVYSLSPGYDTLRTLKLKKTKKDKLPKDTLTIRMFYADSVIKIARVKSYKLPEDSSNFIAYQFEKEIKDKKKEEGSKKKKGKKKKRRSDKSEKKADIKEEGTIVHVANPITGDIFNAKNCNEYVHSKYGDMFGFVRNYRSDKIDSTSIRTYDTHNKSIAEIFKREGVVKSLVFDLFGDRAAFLHSSDTVKDNKVFNLYLWNGPGSEVELIVDSMTDGMPESWCVSEYSKIYFSKDSRRLFFGTNVIPYEIAEDTLLEDEKYKVDVWSWHDEKLQPQQLVQLKREKKRNYTSVYHIAEKKFKQLGTELIESVRIPSKGNSNYALGVSYKPYNRIRSWMSPAGVDLYCIDVNTGERTLIHKKVTNRYYISSTGQYIIWYNSGDNSWQSYNCKDGTKKKISFDIDVSFANERHNTPNEAYSYGIGGWTENDEDVLVYDRYDIWSMDPKGDRKPFNLTKGRTKKDQHRLRKLNTKLDHYKKEKQLIKVFNETNKKEGFAYLDLSDNSLDILFSEDIHLGSVRKSANTENILYQRSNFYKYPDLYLTDSNFSSLKKISDANPQQEEYLWASVELVSWKSFDGKDLNGLLYKPENFDTSRSYPMIVYFYERYSDLYNYHFPPRPSRSTISFSFYASNGYVVFVPDIEYGTGHPGKDAYNAVVSGTEYILSKHKNIDRSKVGIQGQSWGGYQTAHIITQTDMFAAAMAGAPVSNMTSAYGGIRWGSGMSRMFQYERSQSRIGNTLWNARDLYIENSPVFFAPNVKTPLLIMHNDNDGAVPWYQGIELFVALRRLDKPVWLLNYNKEQHNLMKWPNRIDLSIRMKQFFDHYLMDKPAASWMVNGLPAIEKGRKTGYELVD